ncbi:restriction endonuclease subunit S [Pseudomonas viridiflava]|uniref:restriction endonuclease subunit S n=1 Tax=Pseudomonas viridiflava TaxID=33069 RepID=UPI00197B2FBC|nr:restriction endonuclease subunit S [Pseudomonas viridiflava]
MIAVEKLMTDHLDIWTSAIKRKSAAGRGSSKKIGLYGIKKLRELILDLAVRGLLVSQSPEDEPASQVLKRFAVEKNRLLKEAKIKKEKKLPPIGDEEKPFDLPEGWAWTRLADIGYNFGQKTPSGKLTYIDVGSINNKLGLIEPTVIDAEEAPSRARKIVKAGTVIYSTIRPYLLNIAVIQKDFHPELIASTAFAVVHPFEGVTSRYLYSYLRSPIFVSYVESVQGGIAYPAINDRQFFSGLFPMPPTDEQHRIVAKVDELLALCDNLEHRTEGNLDAHQTLVETLLGSLTSSADHMQLTSAWQRIATHFDILFTSEQSIDQLKQAILQLAIMGKLVPQDPTDEPASEHLKRIAAGKAKLVKEGKIKRDTPLSPIGNDEKPFESPKAWEWVRLEQISTVITKGSSPKWQGVEYTDNVEDVLFVTSENIGNFKLLLDSKKYVEKKFNEIEPRSILKKGDFLMNIVGASIGRTAVFDIDALANINQAVCLIRAVPDSFSNMFLLIFFNSSTCIDYMYDKQVDNARANLSMGNIAKFLIPVPPYAEQHRIVAKVGELMSLCDELTTRLIDTQITKTYLADSLSEQAFKR